MKKIWSAVVLFGLSLPVLAQATEFQPIGSLGFGGAGVARNTGALTAYWNPAGGAFNDTPFAMYVGAGAGVRASNGLAENVDRLSGVDFDSINKFDSSKASSVGDMVKLLSTLEDAQKRNGNLSLGGEASLGFSIKHFSFGVFGNLEGYVQPNVDTTNILPTNVGGTTTTSVKDLYTSAVNTSPIPSTNTSGYFTNTQFNDLATRFSIASGVSGDPNYITTTQAGQLVNAITGSSQLQGSGIPASSTYSTLVNLATSMTSGSSAQTLGSTFNKNTSYVTTKYIDYVEVPFAYGHPFNFGKNGKLGIGATAKIISGNVSQSTIQLVNRPNDSSISAKDLMKDITKNSESSVNFGVDLGAMYKYDKWLTVGVVGKNLNSPRFAAPEYSVPVYNETTKTVDPQGGKKKGEDVVLKPQARAGVAVEPWKWLTLASDIDLTENDVVAPGSVVGSSAAKSRNFGGGAEIHPYSWLRVRGGAYKNLADSDVGMVVTGGVTLFLLDIDAAMATKTFKVSGSDVPQEAKVQVALSFAF